MLPLPVSVSMLYHALHGMARPAALVVCYNHAPCFHPLQLLHFGGEVAELRAVHGGDKGGDSMPISADLQMGSVSSSGPTFRPGDSFAGGSAAANVNPFAQPV